MIAKKIIVGISGGVDSAVSALLLKQQGWQVEGLFMFNWAEDEAGYCNAAEDFQTARQVCDELDIPLHRADFSAEYRERVFQQFLDEYAAGRTPNPDVLCNREIKFRSFLEHAARLGAPFVATGHYAGVEEHEGQHWLVKAADGNKDQTYFLALVPEAAFARTHFPLAGLRKPEVRELAQKAGLPNHARKDSTGICFIGERPMREFLNRYLPAPPGPIMSLDRPGEVLGEHSGLIHYTPGQRKGLRVGGRRGANEAPWYVVRKDLKQNILFVSQDNDNKELCKKTLLTGPSHWIGPPPRPGSYTARIRHRQQEQLCQLQPQKENERGGLRVEFAQAQRAMTAGQYVVFYQAQRCLGGAVIERVGHESS
ncbi:MAG: tRNA 2-thiouridine(34) synthase MnmA [Nevskiales bacterium]